MNIGVTGIAGFVGRHLECMAQQQGHTLLRFSRHPQQAERLFNTVTPPDIRGCDALIHLAGEPIFGLWTKSKQKKIIESRRLGTQQLIKSIAHSPTRPHTLVSASAIGYYGDRGDEILEESSPRGSGFLSEVAACWEHEALQATQYGVRVICLRFGLVLGKEGGFLKIALPFFRSFLGAQLGDGQQWMSCIHIDDLIRMILWCLEEKNVSGILNAVMPTPITNKDFTKRVAQSLGRPTFFPIPKWILHLVFRSFSHILLDSQRVIPRRAEEAGFLFQYPTLKAALQNTLQQNS